VRDSIPLLVSAARAAGLDETGLYETMTARLGLSGERRLVDLLVAGEDRQVIETVRGRA
jgi:hypothetical protein